MTYTPLAATLAPGHLIGLPARARANDVTLGQSARRDLQDSVPSAQGAAVKSDRKAHAVRKGVHPSADRVKTQSPGQ